METSILLNTKKMLGLAEDYDVFDLDVITHINSAFSTLTQLGVGPEAGFMIEDDTAVWSDFISDDLQYNSVKSYIFLRVRQLFDPPTTSYLISAVDSQIKELEWRLNVHREETEWVDPNPYPPVDLEDRVYFSNTLTARRRVLDNGAGTPAVGPKAAFTMAPNPAAAYEQVNLDATMSTPGSSPIKSYHWDNGAGWTYDLPVVGTVFYYPGTYTMTLTVTDENGVIDVTSQTIVIT